MAAALTYHSVFSLLPTIVLVLITQQTFLEADDRAALKSKLVDILIEPITSDMEPDETESVSLEVSAETAKDLSDAELRQLEFQQYRMVMEKEATAVLEHLESVSLGGIGFFGLLLFIYGTTGLLTTIESTFDEVLCAHKVRPAFRRIPVYYAILTLGPVVLLAGQWAQNKMIEAISTGSWAAWLGGPLIVMSPILSVWALLYAMFVLMPTTRVNLRAAAIGSLISALFWVAAIELFQLYVSRAAITSLYGALALLPLSLFWLFITWQLILLGVEFTYAVQMLSETGRMPDKQDKVVTPTTLSPGWTLEIAVRVAAAFQRGSVISLGEIQRSTGLPRLVTRTLLNALSNAGIIHEIDGRRGYGLARPADSISLDELLEIHRITEQKQTLVRIDAPTLYTQFNNAGRDGFGTKTLGDLVSALAEPSPRKIPELVAPLLQRSGSDNSLISISGANDEPGIQHEAPNTVSD